MAKHIQDSSWEVLGLDREHALNPHELKAAGVSVLHIHWPIYLYKIPQRAPRVLDRWLRIARRVGAESIGIAPVRLWQTYIGLRMKSSVSNWSNALAQSGIKLVWEIHDLCTHRLIGDPIAHRFDYWLHRTIFNTASGIIIHEESSKGPVEESYGKLDVYSVAPLGDYKQIHGEQISKEEARLRLGLKDRCTIFAYIGTARKNRNPSKTIEGFREIARVNDHLIIAGSGMRNYIQAPSDDAITVIDGLIENGKLRDIICAADYIVNDAKQYLTSAVIRAAISYAIPVIAYPFGTAIDMAQGALIPIDDAKDGIAGALKVASSIDNTSYANMREYAAIRNQERTWDRMAQACVDLYVRVTSL